MKPELVGLSEKGQKCNFLKSPNVRFVPFEILSVLTKTYLTALTDWVARSIKLGCVKTCSVAKGPGIWSSASSASSSLSVRSKICTKVVR